MRRLAANLRRFRDARGLSQDDVIYLADVDRRGYQRLENGRARKNPTVKTLFRIAEILKVSLQDLFN
jgi:transcriptional regulator with XRE-family HTH domain